MPTPRTLVATRPEDRPDGRRGCGDAGVSVIEMMVAIAVIGTVMTAMAPFLVKTMVSVSEQRTQQVAMELATDALERARALKPSSLTAGRGSAASAAQRDNAPQRVKDLIPAVALAWDAQAPPDAGPTAPLPTQARDAVVHGVTYRQNWYVGNCWQPPAGSTATPVALGGCQNSGTATDAAFFRIVVAVTWKVGRTVAQAACPAGECLYLASTLVSTATDPMFDLNRPPPTITTPADQYAWVGTAASYQLHASGGTLPRTWAATGLPPGLTVAADTGLVSGTPATVGSYTVTVTVTDGENRVDDVTFTWIVAAAFGLTHPGDQTSRTGTAVSLAIAATGGHRPLRSWAATGLPAGLSINVSTGVVSGTPTTEQITMQDVTVTAVDAANRPATVTFGWRVLTPLVSAIPSSASFAVGSDANNFQLVAQGGLPPYTWNATGLPEGFSADAAGRVTGRSTSGGRYLVTVRAVDAAGGPGGTIAQEVVCTVTVPNGWLQVNAVANQTGTVGTPATLTPTANKTGVTWSASGLPPGLSLSGGTISGTPTTAGRYIVTVVATKAGTRAYWMFPWTVTA